MHKLIGEFQALHRNVTIEYVVYDLVPRSPTYDPRLLTALNGDSDEPPPDIFDIGDWDVALFRELGWLQPVPSDAFGAINTANLIELYERNSLKGLYVEGTDGRFVEGQLYGIPSEYNALHTYYRADQFVKVGLDPEPPMKDGEVQPWTWQQLGEMGRRLTLHGDEKFEDKFFHQNVDHGDLDNVAHAGFQWPYRPVNIDEWVLKQFYPLLYQWAARCSTRTCRSAR